VQIAKVRGCIKQVKGVGIVNLGQKAQEKPKQKKKENKRWK
jgi:hypothetical protein